MANVQKTVNGHVDDRLNEIGIQQAKELGLKMK